MESRRSYPVFIMFNGRVFNEVRIDPHYEENHSSYMNDEKILRMIKKLNRLTVPAQKSNHQWSYFEVNHVERDGRLYRVILCSSESESYLGVINCYRIGNKYGF